MLKMSCRSRAISPASTSVCSVLLSCKSLLKAAADASSSCEVCEFIFRCRGAMLLPRSCARFSLLLSAFCKHALLVYTTRMEVALVTSVRVPIVHSHRQSTSVHKILNLRVRSRPKVNLTSVAQSSVDAVENLVHHHWSQRHPIARGGVFSAKISA